MAAALNQQQQLKNEATEMAMRVALYFVPNKRHREHQRLHCQVWVCCTAMGMITKEEKCSLFESYLRGKATQLWINPEYHGVESVYNWNSVKQHFTIRYKGKVETNTFCQNCFKRKLNCQWLCQKMHLGDNRIHSVYQATRIGAVPYRLQWLYGHTSPLFFNLGSVETRGSAKYLKCRLD